MEGSHPFNHIYSKLYKTRNKKMMCSSNRKWKKIIRTQSTCPVCLCIFRVKSELCSNYFFFVIYWYSNQYSVEMKKKTIRTQSTLPLSFRCNYKQSFSDKLGVCSNYFVLSFIDILINFQLQLLIFAERFSDFRKLMTRACIYIYIYIDAGAGHKFLEITKPLCKY